jgi:hypothetical protein
MPDFEDFEAEQKALDVAAVHKQAASVRDFRSALTDRAFRAPMHQAPPAGPREPPSHPKGSPSSREGRGDQPTIAGSK